MGICLFTLMIMMTLQMMTATLLINNKIGIDFLFYMLGIVQFIGFFIFVIFMKETQGLTTQQKKALYVPKTSEQIQQDLERKKLK